MAEKLADMLELMKACLTADELDCKLAEWLVRCSDTWSADKLDKEMALKMDSSVAASTVESMGRR